MSLTMEDLDRRMTDAKDHVELKIKLASQGNDCVVDTHHLSSSQLLELCAIAKLGLPFWYREGSGKESAMLQAMRDFAAQKTPSEMNDAEAHSADFEGAYATMVFTARKVMEGFGS